MIILSVFYNFRNKIINLIKLKKKNQKQETTAYSIASRQLLRKNKWNKPHRGFIVWSKIHYCQWHCFSCLIIIKQDTYFYGEKKKKKTGLGLCKLSHLHIVQCIQFSHTPWSNHIFLCGSNVNIKSRLIQGNWTEGMGMREDSLIYLVWLDLRNWIPIS